MSGYVLYKCLLTHDTPENDFENIFTHYLKKSCGLESDQQFSDHKYITKIVRAYLAATGMKGLKR